MVKGVNKQMIVLRIDGNRIYESACFVLKNEALPSKATQRDMLDEANRLLAEMDIKKARPKKRRTFWRIAIPTVLFVLGVLAGFALSFAF